MDNYFVNSLKKGYQTGTGGNGITGLLENPLFNIGMGLFASNHSGGNPYEAVLGALQQSRQAKTAGEKRRKEKTLEDKLKELAEANQSQQAVAQAAQGMPLNAVPQASALPQAPSPFSNAPQTPTLPQVAQTPPPAPMPAQPNGLQSSDIASTLLQYGSPEDRRAVMSNLSASERFKQNLAQEEAQFSQGQTLRRDLAGDSADLQRELQGQRIAAQQSSGAAQPANVREWEYFNNLDESQQADYLDLRRGTKPSSTTEKRLYDYNDNAFKARSNVNKYENLATRMVQVDPVSGVIGKWTENAKRILGTEDAVTNLRKEWNDLRVSAAVQNLPPGVASDKDIELVMSSFLPENANPQAISSFMRGLSKLEKIRAEYNEFAADYISQDPRRGAIGLDRTWRDRVSRQPVNPAISTSDDQLINRWLNP